MADIADEKPGDRRNALGMLPYGTIGRRANGWWGMMTLVVTEGFLFLYLLFSYYYFLLQMGPDLFPREAPSFRLSAPSTIMLILSSVAVWWAERGIKRNRKGQGIIGLIVGILLGAGFIVIQVFEWSDKPFRLDSHPYGSLYFTTTGFHLAHVAGGLLILCAMLVWTIMGYFDSERHTPVSCGAIYWHFVDAVWLTVFFTYYITPYLG